MNRHQVCNGALVAGISFCAGALTSQSVDNDAAERIPSWEYGTLVMNKTLTKFYPETHFEADGKNFLRDIEDPFAALDMVGSRGWELVTFERLGDFQNEQRRWQFKRLKRQAN